MSFNTALSGLQAASQRLDVTGNNIANSNTAGFKRARAQFSDVYAASSLGTSSTAIGAGVRLSGVTQQFTGGNIVFTPNSLDLAINGSGFFQLSDNGTRVYSRAGYFSVDKNGFVVDNNNRRLLGSLADTQGNITGAQGPLQLSAADLNPRATSVLGLTCNLDSSENPPIAPWVGTAVFGGAPPAANTFNRATSTEVFDSLGNKHVLTMYFIKSATPNQWDVRAQIDGVDVNSNPAAAPFTQVFNSNGSFNVGSSEAITLSWNPLNSSGGNNGASTPQSIVIDMSTSTQYGSAFGVQDLTQDGFETGRLNQIDVDSSGVLFGRYSNGQSLALGQVTLANFRNPEALQPIGNTSWGETFGSGAALVGAPGSSSLGLVQSGALEQSNVPLTDELVDLITAQRDFQANAQSIRTLDTVEQSIINIK